MKDIKNTIKAVSTHSPGQMSLWQQGAKKVWRTYLLLPLASALCVLGIFDIVCHTMVPAWKMHEQTADWGKAFAMIQVDYTGSALTLLGFIATLIASQKARRSMLSIVTKHAKSDISSNRRNLLLTESVMLVLLIFWVGALPLASLLFSGAAAGGSGLGSAVVATPLWVMLSLSGFTFLFVLALEVVLTFVRLCFRETSSYVNP